MTPQTFVFIGRSGCGKGTQVELLEKILHEQESKGGLPLFHLETGTRFRAFAGREDNYTAHVARGVLSNGRLTPEFIAIYFWATALIEGAQKDQHWVFDGICRKPAESPVFAGALDFYGRMGNDVHIIHINVSRAWARERLFARGRADDTEDAIERRQNWFDKDVTPSLEYFKTGTNFHFCDVNGEQSIEDVHKEIMDKLNI